MSRSKGIAAQAGRITPHTVRERLKLANRVRRIAGQIDAVEESLDSDADCERV